MQLFRYKEDRLPIAIFAAYFAIDIALYFTVHSPWVLLVWVGLGIVPKGCICAWNHHHQHAMTFRYAPLNRALEVMYGFQTGIVGHGWVLHHVLGHHLNYLDQTKDESRWKRDDGSTMGELEYSLVVSATAYPRAFGVGRKHPREMRVFLGMAALMIAMLGALIWHDWQNALLLFVLPMLIGIFVTVWATYAHHSGLDTADPYKATRNTIHTVYNICTGNLGYHTAHHLRSGLHWSRLPEFHARVAAKIPAECYIEPGFPWFLFGKSPPPTLTEEAGRNAEPTANADDELEGELLQS